MKNNFKSGLQKALDELENITPLKPFNCGRLCSAHCCSGGDNDGMGLFPGEKELLESCADFEIKDSEGNFGEPVIVCRGSCDRRKRPLACRIFPLFPLAVGRENEIVVVPVPDPRAGLCPLLTAPLKSTGVFTEPCAAPENISCAMRTRENISSTSAEK